MSATDHEAKVTPMPTPDQVRTAVEAYVEHLGNDREQAWLDLFDEGATVVDPVPSDPHEGREAIAAFWAGITGMADRVAVERHAVHVCGGQAALVYTMTLATADGGAMAFDGVEIFEVDDTGLITSARAYWDPAELRRVEPPVTPVD